MYMGDDIMPDFKNVGVKQWRKQSNDGMTEKW